MPSRQSDATLGTESNTIESETLQKTHAELQNYYTLLRLVTQDLENITRNFVSINGHDKKMAVRRSVIHPRLEDLDSLSMLTSPLRQRSSLSRVDEPADASGNDDDAERLQPNLDKKQLQAGEVEKHRSLGLGCVPKMSNPQIVNSMTMCVKLSVENKINVKNVFSLDMIDFMTYMIKKRNSNISNMHEASTWLDTSTKIYGLRVDSVHMETLKMIGRRDKQETRNGKWDSGLGGGNSDPGSDNDVEGERIRRAQKKKSKQKILASAESLRAPLDLISPASMVIDEPDSQTTRMLFQAILPVHANSDLYLHPYDDVILDTVNPEQDADVNNKPVDDLCFERFGHLELCSPFANFEFLGWSMEEELELELALEAWSQSPVEDDDFQFDLEASLPTDDEGPSGMNYFEVEDDNENIEVHDIMNMQSGLQTFSAENIDGSRIVKGCTQESNKHNVDAVMSFDEESFNAAMDKFEIVKNELLRLDKKTLNVAWSEKKITSPLDVDYDDFQYSRYYFGPEVIRKLTQKDEMNGTFLPVEVGNYDYNNNGNATRDYFSNIKTEDHEADNEGNCSKNRQADNEENCSNLANFKEDIDYDYNNNENVTSDYCSNVETEDRQADNEENCNDGVDLEEETLRVSSGIATQSFTGDNLVEAPKMTNRIFMPFSQRATKIDMRDLKRAMWEDLTSAEGVKENVDVETSGNNNAEKVNDPKKFSDIVKNLPKKVTKSNAEALSVPIAFMSLLHLANEKNLQIDSTDDRIDFHIRQG